jgi:ppGpp synthetase/RelA/SpoT-type nucleotidyltranferase
MTSTKSMPLYAADNSMLLLARAAFRSSGHLQQPVVRFLQWARHSAASLQQVVEEKGSAMSKQEMQTLSQLHFPTKAVHIVFNALNALEVAKHIAALHTIVEISLQQLKEMAAQGRIQADEGISLAYTFLLNQAGLKTIELALPRQYAILGGVVRRFYLDDLHPMDLQKLLRDPTRAPQVGLSLRNLIKIDQKACPLTQHFALLEPDLFNRFLTTYVQAILKSHKTTTLLSIASIELARQKLQTAQEAYYLALGVSKEELDRELVFSTPEKRTGIYLYPSGRLGSEDEMTLRVPDADNRVVAISKVGFKILEKLQIQMTLHLFGLMKKLQALFPEHGVTGRVKSASSMLDKCGRLCHQKEAITDIVDGCGCRITCTASSQIHGVVEALRKEFEFLELDNKYRTIRKDGAYKAIHCTLRDLTTGLIFELQITTVTMITVSDLFHNVIYKRNAIGLNSTQKEIETIIAIQRFGALTETVSLVIPEPIILTEKLKTEKMAAALESLREMIGVVLQENRKVAKL